jgi:hypothetical protein
MLSLGVSILGLVNTVVMYLFIFLAVPSLYLEAQCVNWAKIAPWPLNILSRVFSRALLWSQASSLAWSCCSISSFKKEAGTCWMV